MTTSSSSSSPPPQSYSAQDLAVLNILQHPVWIFDVERCTMYWANTAALKLWNADSLQEFLDRDYATDMTQATRQRIRGIMNRVLQGQVVKEQWTYYPSGQATTVQVTASLVYMDGGRPAIMDEAELPSTDFQAAATQDIELLRHVPLPVCRFGLDGRVLYQNPQDICCFGCCCGGSTKEFVQRFVDTDLGQSVLQQVQTGQDCNVEAELYTVCRGQNDTDQPRKTPRFFAISVRRVKDPTQQQENPFFIVYTARDITEILQARKDQNQAKLKSEFMSVMAHEIRTPLHQVVGYADLLEWSGDLNNRQLESVKHIQQSTESLMAIINDLLEYNRIESGKLSVENVHFALKGVLEGCVVAVEAEMAVKGLYFHSVFDALLPISVVGDPNRLRQIMLNLLQNAAKFTEKGGITFKVYSVTLSEMKGNTHMDGQDTTVNQEKGQRIIKIGFQVVDTGIGIDPAHQKIIFQKYQQANTSIARKYGGTGLGLPICQSLVEALGGFMHLESELGQGTTFTVEIPLLLSESSSSALSTSDRGAICEERTHPQDQACLHSIKPLHVLVVEDNLVNQKLVRRMLEKLGYSVDMAENGQVALDKLAHGKVSPDFVLMDVLMPVMDGIEATKQIRNHLNLSKDDLPVVGLTASFQTSDLQTYLEIGMNSCLSKPIRLESLKRTLTSILGNT